jgi:hypothetical protein
VSFDLIHLTQCLLPKTPSVTVDIFTLFQQFVKRCMPSYTSLLGTKFQALTYPHHGTFFKECYFFVMKFISLEVIKQVVSWTQNFTNLIFKIYLFISSAIDTPHVPNLKTILSFLDLLTLCYLVIASNFLDPRTYQYPSTKTNRIPSDDYIKKMKIFDLNDMDAVDRRRCSYARGLAWKITRWCEDNFEIYRTTPTNQVSIHALINTYFATLSKKILAYKSRAQSAKITGVPNCTHELLQQQMMYCFERTEVKAYFDQTPINFENIEDLDYRLPFNYHIRRRDPTTVKNRSTSFNISTYS